MLMKLLTTAAICLAATTAQADMTYSRWTASKLTQQGRTACVMMTQGINVTDPDPPAPTLSLQWYSVQPDAFYISVGGHGLKVSPTDAVTFSVQTRTGAKVRKLLLTGDELNDHATKAKLTDDQIKQVLQAFMSSNQTFVQVDDPSNGALNPWWFSLDGFTAAASGVERCMGESGAADLHPKAGEIIQ